MTYSEAKYEQAEKQIRALTEMLNACNQRSLEMANKIKTLEETISELQKQLKETNKEEDEDPTT